ncbi:MAG TPA: EamA family transporter RarD [Sporosarcina sp.]|nr:EamA family transporter RarD [Sporosarcina sp.]
MHMKGIITVIFSYLIWGILPVYWKTLAHVSSEEILYSRIIWAFILTTIFVIAMRQGPYLVSDVKMLWKQQKQFWLLFLASVLISGNWFIYIWAVNHNHLVQTSLGYYMNPLVSVLLGVFFLKETLSIFEKIAFVLALIGVLSLTIYYGGLPWIAIVLALSFAFYGLIKKQIPLHATRGLAIETFFVMPIALIAYIPLFQRHEAFIVNDSMQTTVLLIGTGIATALPLILFAKGAQQIPLYMVGFLQYIAPTMMLILGVIVYGEAFSKVEFMSFFFIWLALIVFALSKLTFFFKKRALIPENKGI